MLWNKKSRTEKNSKILQNTLIQMVQKYNRYNANFSISRPLIVFFHMIGISRDLRGDIKRNNLKLQKCIAKMIWIIQKCSTVIWRWASVKHRFGVIAVEFLFLSTSIVLTKCSGAKDFTSFSVICEKHVSSTLR